MTLSIQQILKVLITAFWVVVNILVLVNDQNVYINLESIVCANMLFYTYYALSKSRHIITVVYTVFGFLFVLQRVLVVFIDSAFIANLGQGNFTLTTSDVNSAMFFVVLCNASIIILSLTSSNVRYFDRARLKPNRDTLRIIKIYPFVFMIFWGIRYLLMIKTGRGFSVNLSGYDYGVLARLIDFVLSLNILLFAGLFLSETRSRKWPIIGVVLLFMMNILLASKAALLGILFQVFLCYIFVCSYRFKLKYIILFCGLILVGIFLVMPALMHFRYMAINSTFKMSTISIINLLITSIELINFRDIIMQSALSMSERMALFEWLASFIHFGRESFISNINLHHLFLDFVNSFIPGSLYQSDYLDVSLFISSIWLRVFTEMNNELPGGYGALYLYFGYIGGVFVFASFYWFFCFIARKGWFLPSLLSLIIFYDFLIAGLAATSLITIVNYTIGIIFMLYLAKVYGIAAAIKKNLSMFKFPS